MESEEESLAAVISVARKGDAATSKCRALGKINPIVDDDDSVFDDSGTSKEVVTQKKARTLPPGINLTFDRTGHLCKCNAISNHVV